MAIRTYILKANQQLNKAQIAELKNLRDFPIVYDEDCRKLTAEELAKFKRVSDIKSTHKHFTLDTHLAKEN